jgi:hypothetical protein
MSWYRAGTVTVTNGTPTVTGSGTAFVANVSIGDAFEAPDGKSYEIINVVSDTVLTLGINYNGSTASGQGYGILPTQSYIHDLATTALALLNSFATVRDGVGAGLFPDGTVGTPAGRFASDQDTGFYRVGANQFGIVTGGVQRALFDGNGLTIDVSGGFIQGKSGVALVLWNPTNSNSVQVSCPTSGDFRVSTGGETNAICATASGNVGIGTASPQTKFVVSNAGANGYEFDPANSYVSSYNRTTSLFTAVTFRAASYTFNINNSNDAVTIDPNGYVGIGTASPNYKLHVYAASGAVEGTIQTGGSAGANLNLRNADRIWSLTNQAGGVLYVYDTTAAAIRLGFQTSGHLTPGADNTQDFGSGALRWANVRAKKAQLGGTPNSGGGILDLHHPTGIFDSTAPYLTFNYTNADPHFSAYMDGNWHTIFRTYVAGSGGTPDIAFLPLGVVRPGTDNNIDLGKSSHRWAVVYAGTGTINTSDEREKTWRGAPSEDELRAAKRIVGELGFYQWNDAVAEKGPDGARLHFGVRAQKVWAIMADEGLVDPLDKKGLPGKTPYAFLCFDAWDEVTEPIFEEVEMTREVETVTQEPDGEDEDGNPLFKEVKATTEEVYTERVATGETRVTLAKGNRFGLRVDQLILFLVAAQEARLAALEAAV